MARSKKERPSQTDNITLGYTVSVEGTDPHLMLEQARLEAARVLRVSPNSLRITSHTPPQPSRYTPFRANLSVPLHVEAIAMSVSFKIKEDVNLDEQSAEARDEDPLDEG